MGNYSIHIKGVGAHHNGDENGDADIGAKMFVEMLQSRGHTIESAEFHEVGGRHEDLCERDENGNVVVFDELGSMSVAHAETEVDDGTLVESMTGDDIEPDEEPVESDKTGE